MDKIYVVTRSYVSPNAYLSDRVPFIASTNYQKLLKFVDGCCKNILENSNPWFDEYLGKDHEPLYQWTGVNFYQVATDDQTVKIIFRN